MLSCIFAQQLYDKEEPVPSFKPTTHSSINTNHRVNENNLVSFKFLRNGCVGNVKPSYRSISQSWSGTFKCPLITEIVGISSKISTRNGAIQMAIKDFVRKALAAKIITPNSYKHFLN